MMNRKSLMISALAVFSMFLISGCSGSAEKDAKADIKDGFKNLYAVTSATFDVSLSGDMKELDGKASNFSLTMKGSSDMENPKAPKFNFKINGEGSADGQAAQAFDGEVRLDEKNVFFMVSKVPDLGELVPAEMITPFVGKWWKMPIPPGTFDKASLPTGDEKELSEQQKKVRALLEETVFFKDLTFVAEENGNNHYSGTLDKEALKKFVVEVNKIMDSEMSESDTKAFEDGLNEIDVNADIWVDAKEKILTKLSGKVIDLKTDDGTDSAEFSMAFGGFNEDVEIEEPEGAEDFNPLMLLGQPTP